MHVSSGCIHHLLDEVRSEIRSKLDKGNAFLIFAKKAKKQIAALLSRLSLTETGVDKIDIMDEDCNLDDIARHKSKSQLLLPLHRDSLNIR